MLIPYENRAVFIASKPMDLRLSIDGLSRFIQQKNETHIHDGSIYVFYNTNRDKIKCLFWDGNGFVLYYKRLDKCKFKVREMLHEVENISPEELVILLSGFEPKQIERHPLTIEHKKELKNDRIRAVSSKSK
jgi:transposase